MRYCQGVENLPRLQAVRVSFDEMLFFEFEQVNAVDFDGLVVDRKYYEVID